MQRESDLHIQVYDERYSVVLLLDDVRVGDIVEYSYTITGWNSVFDGKFFYEFPLKYGSPVHDFRITVLHDTNRKLSHKTLHSECSPTITEQSGMLELQWVMRSVKPYIWEPNTPSWLDEYPKALISEFQSWLEVAKWGAELTKVPENLSPELLATANQLKATTNIKSLENMLEFVQNEIRYLAISIGISSHRPFDPNLVLERRFGDCKDKTLLLKTLLSCIGIESTAVLVNGQFTRSTMDKIPSPSAFDHMIVVTTVDNQTLWLDPTIRDQSGSLLERYLPDYSSCLVLNQFQDQLTLIPRREHNPLIEIEDYFRVEDYARPVSLSVETRYHGYEADRIRYIFSHNSIDELEKAWLKHYASRYPDISRVGRLSMTDDKEKNI